MVQRFGGASGKGNEIAAFLNSLKPANWFRIALTVVLTTGSVFMASQGSPSTTLLIGCNLMTISGAFYMEYRNFKARQ